MGLFKKLFGEKNPPAPEHAVIVEFYDFGTDLSDLFELESRLEAKVLESAVGELDGNEVATDGSDGRLYFYGPDADQLFACIRPILEESPLMRGAKATIQYGPPGDGVREIEVSLGT